MTASTPPPSTVRPAPAGEAVGGRPRVRGALMAVPLVVALASGAAGCVRFSEPGARPAPSTSAGAAHAGGHGRSGGGTAPVGDALPVRPAAARAQVSPGATSAVHPTARPTRAAGGHASGPALPQPPADPGAPQTPTVPELPPPPPPPPPVASDTPDPTDSSTPVGEPPSSGPGGTQGYRHGIRHAARHR